MCEEAHSVRNSFRPREQKRLKTPAQPVLSSDAVPVFPPHRTRVGLPPENQRGPCPQMHQKGQITAFRAHLIINVARRPVSCFLAAVSLVVTSLGKKPQSGPSQVWSSVNSHSGLKSFMWVPASTCRGRPLVRTGSLLRAPCRPVHLHGTNHT